MLEMSIQEPDLVLGGSHLGRGSFYFDKDVCLTKFDFQHFLNVMIILIDFT